MATTTSTTAFPDATTAGVPQGTTLKPSGSIVVNTPGAVIEGLDIKGTVTINAPDVTLKNCRISAASFDTVLIKAGVTGVTVQNCDIDNQNSGGQALAGQGTFLNNNIHNAADGIDVRGDNTVIEGNFIHDLGGTADSHFDGIQAGGGFDNLTITHNTVINDHGQTAALNLNNDFGSVNGAKITDNLLVGGGYTTYLEEAATGNPVPGGHLTNIVYSDNHIDPGVWGPLDLVTDFGDHPTISNNVNDGATLVSHLAMTGQPASDGGVAGTPPSSGSTTDGSGSTTDPTGGSSGSTSPTDGSGTSNAGSGSTTDPTGGSSGSTSPTAGSGSSGHTGTHSHHHTAGHGSTDPTGTQTGTTSPTDGSGSHSGTGTHSQHQWTGHDSTSHNWNWQSIAPQFGHTGDGSGAHGTQHQSTSSAGDSALAQRCALLSQFMASDTAGQHGALSTTPTTQSGQQAELTLAHPHA